LPKQFKFPEFPLNYWYINYDNEWIYSIDHNEYQWIDLEIFKDELVKNLRGPLHRPSEEDLGLTSIVKFTEPHLKTVRFKDAPSTSIFQNKRGDDEPEMFYRTHIDFGGKYYNFEVPAITNLNLPKDTNFKVGDPDFADGEIEYSDGYYRFGGMNW